MSRRVRSQPGRVAFPAPPRIGQRVVVRGVTCEVVRVRAAGTIDVLSLDGRVAWRLSGLAWGTP